MFFEKNKKMKIWIMIAVFTLIVLGIVLAIVLPSNDALPANAVLKQNGPITISFNAEGGNPVEDLLIESATSLTEENYPIAFKNGYQFVGWYYDDECLIAYNGEALLLDITLHAKYIESMIIDNSTGALGFCEKDISFKISSTEELTNANWKEYIVFTDFCNTEIDLKIEKIEDSLYKLYSEQEFVEGGVYGVALVDDKITRFMAAGDKDLSLEGINEYTFQIAMEIVNNIKKVDDIITVNTSDLIDRTYNVRTYSDKEVDTIIVIKMPEILMNGSIIALTNTNDVVSQYYKVIDFTRNEKTGVVTLDVIEPIMSEVFDEFDISFNGGEDAIILQTDEETLINNIRDVILNDSDFQIYAKSLFENAKNTPTVQNLLKNATEKERLEFLALEFNINGVTITPEFKIEETEEGGGKISLGITFSNMKIPIGTYAEVSLSINFTQVSTITPSGNTRLYNEANGYYGNQFVIDYLGEGGGEFTYQDTRMNKSSTTGFGFEATIAFKGKKTDDDSTDNSKKDNPSSIEFGVNQSELAKDLVKELNEIFTTDEYIADVKDSGMFTSDKLSYQDVAEIPLGKIVFNVGGVVDISIDVKAHLKIGAQATLATSFKVTNQTLSLTRNASIDNATYADTKLAYLSTVPIEKKADYEKFNIRLQSKFEYDITLKGKIGVRMGLSISFGISPTGLSNLLYVGIKAEAGVYVEISGYVQFTGSVIKDSEDNIVKKFDINGGIYLEAGIYLDVSFVWKALKWDGEFNICDKTWPLFSIGTAEQTIDFVDDYDAVAFSGGILNLLDDNTIPLEEYEGDKQDNVFNVDKINLENGVENRNIKLNLDKYRIAQMPKYVTTEYIKDGETYISSNLVYPFGEYIRIENDIIYVDTEKCPDTMQFEIAVEVIDTLSLINGGPMYKIVNCIYVKNEQDLKDFKQYEVSFYDQRGIRIDKQYVYSSFIPIEPSLRAWNNDPENIVYEYDNNSPKWSKSIDGEAVELEPIYENVSYYLDANPKKLPINFYYYMYDENGNEYQENITVDAYPLIEEEPYNGQAPYNGLVIAPNTDNFPAREFRDIDGKLFYSYEFRYWQAYASGYISDDSKIDFETMPVITIGQYGITAKQDIYAYYYSSPIISRFGGICYYYYESSEIEYKAPDFPENNVSDEYFSSIYWMGQNKNGDWINLYPGDSYEPSSDQYCEEFYFCDKRLSDSVVYLDYYNNYVTSKIVKNGEETLMSVGPELSNITKDNLQYIHTGWKVTIADSINGEIISIPDDNGIINGYQRLCTPIYTKYSGKIETTTFVTNGWDCKDNAPTEYNGVNLEIENDNYKFVVPGLIGADNEELEFLWKSTEMVNGHYLSCYPGEKIHYKNITYIPDIKYEVNIAGTGNVYIYEGNYGETFNIAKMKEDIPLLFLASNNSPDGFAYEIIDWVVPEGYKFGDTKDESGYPELEVWFNLKTAAHIGNSTVTFDANDGKFSADTQNVFSGENNTSIGFLTEPVKENYIDNTGSEHRFNFYGWNTDINADTSNYGYKGSELKFGQEGIILNDVTYYAIYNETVFHPITYNTGGGIFADGTSINKVFFVENGEELPHNQNPALVADTTKKDVGNTRYTFYGWSSLKNNSHAFAPDILTAIYNETPINCTVTYNANGGIFADGTRVKTTTVSYLAELPTLEEIESGLVNPIKIDANHVYKYEFSGWLRNKGAINDLVMEDTILSAQYTESLLNYIVTFDSGTGSYINVDLSGTGFTLSGTDIAKIYQYNDSSYYPPDPTPADGQFFAGWNAVIPNMISQSVTYTAIYTSNISDVKTITFNATASGAFANGKQTIAFRGMKDNDVNFMLKPTSVGSEFSNWNPEVTIFGESDQEVMAVYAANIIKITFDSNGGSFSSDRNSELGIVFEREGNNLYRNIYNGDFIAYPVEPTAPANMFFAGWDKTMFDVATQSTTFKAVYVDDASKVASVIFNSGIDPYSIDPENPENDMYVTFTFGESQIIVKGVVGQAINFARIPIGYSDGTDYYSFSGWAPATATPALPTNFVDGYEYVAQYTLE